MRRLGEFGVEAEIMAINPGPVVTRFEIDPAPGIKVSRITNLAKDLARSLAVISVRVVEVIAGKSTVGIEIPNQFREMVRLSQILGSEAYKKIHLYFLWLSGMIFPANHCAPISRRCRTSCGRHHGFR